ncbi:MAG: GDP-mannose 4,6-dehydratase [Gemmataceae bacterium]|nr:GDP-mannose 4,6-dehydratase [Gemmataceae bacterium]MDW8263978.1 GDP-mannose 4,6-dehydratase [Gemmataceae bacterium]
MTQHTVVVLGANSFSGQDLVDLLLDDPRYRVIGISRSPERSAVFLRYRRRADLSRYQYHALNLNRDMPAILELLDRERPALIVNFAAQSEVAPSWEYPEHWYQTNTVALARLVNHLRRQDYLRRYLHISSPEIYGTCVGTVREDAVPNPSTPYAASKAAADQLLHVYHKQFGFPVLWVRATNVYGAGQQLYKIIPRSIIYIKLGRTIELHGGGRAVKSYIHIRDVSLGEKAILERGRVGQIYHLSPDAGVAVRDVVERICRLLGKTLPECTRDVAERPGQDAAYVIDSSRARQELGWSPTIPLEQGLAEVVDWIDANWQTIRTLPLTYEHRP